MTGEHPSEQTQRIDWASVLPAGYDIEARNAETTQALNAAVHSMVAARTAGGEHLLGEQTLHPQVPTPPTGRPNQFGGWFKEPTPTTYGTPRAAITAGAETTEAGTAQTETTALQGHANAESPVMSEEKPATVTGRAPVAQAITLGQITAGGQKSPAVPVQPYKPRHYGTAKVEQRRPTRRGRRIALAVGTMAAVTALAFGAHTPAIASDAPRVVDKIEKTYLDIVSTW